MLLGLITVWGVNFSIVKGAVSGSDASFTPIAFNAFRFAVAALALLALMRLMREARPSNRRDLLLIFGLGLIGNSLYQPLFIVGLSYTSPANSSLIMATVPVIVALIGAALRTERLTGLAWLGIVLSFAGILIVVLGNGSGTADPSQPGTSFVLGDALVFLAAVTWSVYTVLSGPLLKRYPATVVTSLSLLFGALPIILLALPDVARLNWSAVSLGGWSAVLYSGVLAIAAGYAIWNRGVQHLGSARTAVYSNLTPVVAAAVAWLVRGDPLTVYHLIGAAIILTGINLTRRGRQARAEPLPAEE